MNQLTIIGPTTELTTIFQFDSYHYPNITVLADHLGTAEQVDVFILAGTTWLTLTDGDGNIKVIQGPATGTGLFISSLTLAGGPVYGFRKTETLVNCSVYVNPSSRYY